MRIGVFGSSGSGKTTFAKALEREVGLPRLELDGVYHLAGWQERETAEFRQIVDEFLDKPSWVVDGNYGQVRDQIWRRAEFVVFLDLPRWKVTAQLLRRTVGRLLTRKKLWNGNREEWRNFLSTDSEKNLVLWSWQNHGRRREQFDAGRKDPRFSQARFLRLENRRSQRAFLNRLATRTIAL